MFHNHSELDPTQVVLESLSFFFQTYKGFLMYERVVYVERKPYGCLHFLFDCFMTIITCGLWLIWIFIREMRNR